MELFKLKKTNLNWSAGLWKWRMILIRLDNRPWRATEIGSWNHEMWNSFGKACAVCEEYWFHNQSCHWRDAKVLAKVEWIIFCSQRHLWALIIKFECFHPPWGSPPGGGGWGWRGWSAAPRARSRAGTQWSAAAAGPPKRPTWSWKNGFEWHESLG